MRRQPVHLQAVTFMRMLKNLWSFHNACYASRQHNSKPQHVVHSPHWLHVNMTILVRRAPGASADNGTRMVLLSASYVD